MENIKKRRTPNLRKKDKKEILDAYNSGVTTPSALEKHFGFRYSYWAIVATIRKDSPQIKKEPIDVKTEYVEPVADPAGFDTIEKWYDHQIAEIAFALNNSKLTLPARLRLTSQFVTLQGKIKKQQLESHLKGNQPKAIIEFARILKPGISDDEILKIYKEVLERIKLSK